VSVFMSVSFREQLAFGASDRIHLPSIRPPSVRRGLEQPPCHLMEIS
jgi:hypothetical protein